MPLSMSLHEDLGIQIVAKVVSSYYKCFQCQLANNPNSLNSILNLVNILDNSHKRLKNASFVT